MSRSVPLWEGATPDAEIPKRVKLRIWDREDGRCYLTGRKIRPGDSYEFEHVVPLRLNGLHREDNIRLALTEAHKEKTADDRQRIAKADRIAAKHNGLWPASRAKLGNRGFSRSRPLPRDDDALEQAG